MASTPAIATCCFWPIDKSLMAICAYASSSSKPIASCMRSSISKRGKPRFSGPKAMSSMTVLATSWSSGFWKTMPTRWRIVQRSSPLVSVRKPSTCTRPVVGFKMAARSFAKVLFPEPFCPMMATVSPGGMDRFTSCRAGGASCSPCAL